MVNSPASLPVGSAGSFPAAAGEVDAAVPVCVVAGGAGTGSGVWAGFWAGVCAKAPSDRAPTNTAARTPGASSQAQTRFLNFLILILDNDHSINGGKTPPQARVALGTASVALSSVRKKNLNSPGRGDFNDSVTPVRGCENSSSAACRKFLFRL